MRLLMAAVPAEGPLPRQVIRDALAEQLGSEDFTVSLHGLYTIRIHPCNDMLAGKSPFEIVNLPSYSIDCQEDGIQVVMARATTTRILAIIDYADPNLLDQLAQVLSEVGICLST